MKRSKRLLALALALCTVLAMAGCTSADPEQMTMPREWQPFWR